MVQVIKQIRAAMTFNSFNTFRLQNLIILLAVFIMVPLISNGQTDEDEDFWAKQLQTEVEVVDPVYMPVISGGVGVLHFLGDVKNPGSNPLYGSFGYKITVSTFIGKNYNFKINPFFLLGNLQGHDFTISRAMQQNVGLLPVDNLGVPIYTNSSFSTEVTQFGASFEYAFGHFMGKEHSKRFKPYVSVGFSALITNPKGNFSVDFPVAATDSYYHFWSDGTIRNFAETHPESWRSEVIKFGKDYETDLEKGDIHAQGSLSTTTLAIPFEAGFDFFLSYRVNLRIASTLNYCLSDKVDNYDSKIAERYGLTASGLGDMFLFTYAAMNFDLFSDPRYQRIDQYFAEIDFDYDVLMADEDNDMIYDRWDQCPGTPMGVEVDTVLTSPTVGCPFDTDFDGVPDYLDDDSSTPQGSIVDNSGVALTAEKLAGMFEKPTAVRREDIKVIPLAPIWTRSITFTPGVIPEKFKKVDKDGDGYVSFEELLKAVEQFFDQKLDLSTEEMYELNNFFFTQ